MQMRVSVKAPAKINLFLEVTSKRPDGYHNIVTLMHPVPLYDNVILTANDSGTITIDCDTEYVPKDSTNLAWRAAELFFEISGLNNAGLDIKIEKNIPMKAGLAGGSTDAAAVLRGLNELFGKPVSDDNLISSAARIGADVPFCTAGKPMLCKGIGEILIPSPALPGCYIVISVPETGTQTEKAYFMLDKIKKRTVNTADYYSIMESGDLGSICAYAYNCFESVFPKDPVISDILTSNGALTCLLSGSGSSVFGIYDNEEKAKNALSELLSSGYKAFLCEM